MISVDIDRLVQSAIRVSILPWEDELARRVGEGRTNQNKGKSDRHSYDATKLMDNLLANQHAAVAEIGVAKALGAYCYAGIWDAKDHNLFSTLPDVQWGQTEVEVKWRRNGKSMPVDRKDAEADRLVIWAECRLPTTYGCQCVFCSQWKTPISQSVVRVLGGGWAKGLWNQGTSYNGDTNRVSVSPNYLTPIHDIIEGLR